MVKADRCTEYGHVFDQGGCMCGESEPRVEMSELLREARDGLKLAVLICNAYGHLFRDPYSEQDFKPTIDKIEATLKDRNP